MTMNESDNAARYAEKSKRVMDAVELRQPDRIPTAFFHAFWLARYGGITCRELMYDCDKACELAKAAILELDPDIVAGPDIASWGPPLEAMGFKQLEWAGHGVGENQPYQFIDREYMTADEYDDFLFDPTGFYLNKYLPRVAKAYEGFAEMPMLPGVAYLGLAAMTPAIANPAVMRAFSEVQKAGEAMRKISGRLGAFAEEMAALGYPGMFGGISYAPFDYFGDYLRGAKGILTDIRRRPEKLQEAMEKASVFILRQAAGLAERSRNRFVFIPIHWGPDGFMSLQQFKALWWPSFRKVLLGLIELDLIPLVLWEADCTSRLEVIGDDMPRGKMVYWFERTDLFKAKEVLGDVVCLRGNVSPSLMTTGTPQEVDACCRKLIEKVGRDGGFILDTAFGVPDETPLENVRALYRSVQKYSA